MRGRPGVTALAVAATLASAWPLTTLLRTNGWYGAAALALAALGVAGWAGRATRLPTVLVLALQAVLASWVLAATLGLGHGPLGLPGTDIGPVLTDLANEGVATIQRYAAPAPEHPGLAFLLAALVTVVGLLVDLLAVHRRAPAAAGFALLVPYLVAAVNTAGPLPWPCFAVAAGCWLLLVVAEQADAVRSFARVLPQRSSARGRHDEDRVDALVWGARGLAVVLVVTAVLAQTLLPGAQTRFLRDGLGRSTHGSGGTVSLSSDVDITRDLSDRDPAPVLSLHASDLRLGPLAVATATAFQDGRWRVDSGLGAVSLHAEQDAEPLAETDGPTTPTTRQTLTLHGSTLAAPQTVAVGWPVRSTAHGAERLTDGTVRVDRAARDSQLTYLVATPRPADLDRPAERFSPVDPATLALDLPKGSLLPVIARSVAGYAGPGGRPANPYQQALALQAYLRDGDFTYSLQLAPTPAFADGRPMDPASAFLTTKRGYCVQFATSMALMARSLGIPARVRLGFLPGTIDKDGASTVRRSDAHMWPELYLPGTGWTRFEPTPGGRSGDAPAYTRTDRTRTTTPHESRSAAPAPSRSVAAPSPAPTAGPSPMISGEALARWAYRLLALLAVAALLAVVPAAAARTRARRLRAATTAGQRVEAQWLTLRERLADLGVHLADTDTPRTAREAVLHDSSLPPDVRAALGDALDRVEAARYAPTPPADGPLVDDSVLAGIRRTRPLGTRVRALLLPSTGVAALRALLPRR